MRRERGEEKGNEIVPRVLGVLQVIENKELAFLG